MSHPCHKDHLKSIRRIEGQVRGVEKMITNGEYCIEILNQIKAIKNSLVSVEGKILEKTSARMHQSSLSGDIFDDKVDEIVKVLKR